MFHLYILGARDTDASPDLKEEVGAMQSPGSMERTRGSFSSRDRLFKMMCIRWQCMCVKEIRDQGSPQADTNEILRDDRK